MNDDEFSGLTNGTASAIVGTIDDAIDAIEEFRRKYGLAGTLTTRVRMHSSDVARLEQAFADRGDVVAVKPSQSAGDSCWMKLRGVLVIADDTRPPGEPKWE